MLNLKNISKIYNTSKDVVNALNGISVSFRKSEFVSVLGPSGCGKTTLLNIIGGLDKYSDGDLFIDGKSTKEYEDNDWDIYRNHRIGFVFQNYNLIGHLNVYENVALALSISGMKKEEIKIKVIKALKRVGLEDKVYSKPNELSGGQMQRVAIARAIVNDPEIILADEPTGALDSKTSVLIMDILKELSNDKLVIMVTHNPDLAKEYSTRIINLLDGEIIDDSNPFDSEMVEKPNDKSRKTSMSFLMALSLSIKNLFTKKMRTALTVVAGSIGIIGICLVLALSNGFKSYIDKMQVDTMSSYPLSIEEEALNLSDISRALTSANKDLDKYPGLKKVYINKIMDLYSSLYTSNDITDEYIEEVIENIDEDLIYGVKYSRSIEVNLFTDSGLMKQVSNGDNMYVKLSTNGIWTEMIDNQDFIKSQYDVLQGRLPNDKDEVVLVVDEYNRMLDATLMAIGLYEEGQEKVFYSFDELMNVKFRLLTNDEMYVYANNKYNLNGVKVLNTPLVFEDAYNRGLEISVVGIIRPNKSTSIGSITAGVAYLPSMIDYIIERDVNSSIAEYMRTHENIDPMTGAEYKSTSTLTAKAQYEKALKKHGVDNTPTKIEIYAKNFEAKEKVKEYLSSYNKGKDDDKKIMYTDYLDLIVKVMNILINGITKVLLTFSAISLIVSSIMIAIITYISVLERIKEIGVLRSIGARKIDIANVFNAETVVIGLTSGIIGVIFSYLFTIPFNMIIANKINGLNNIMILLPSHAMTMICISVLLTLISGFVPAIMASKKDPVIALRSEK